jgi:hypothetical protein
MFIYQIELSNYCSLKCSYCPHPGQVREKGLMSVETFRKCIALYKLCRNTQPLTLHNFGEALLHPKLSEFIAYARDEGVRVVFFTNGVNPAGVPYPREVWQKLAASGLEEVNFSAHALSAPVFRAIVDGVVRVGRIFDPRTSRMGTWGGQVPLVTLGPVREYPQEGPCLFERRRAFVVLWDGKISACCLDAEGRREELWVDDLLRSGRYEFAPISLCAGCGSMRGEEAL